MFRFLKIIAAIILFLGIFSFSISYFKKNSLPSQNSISDQLSLEPKQEATDMAPFIIEKGVYSYRIEPKYSYDIKGLVVTDYSSENWTNLYRQNDFLNAKDECLIWGNNVKDEIYNKTDFSSQGLVCNAALKEQYAKYDLWNTTFSASQISNNYFLPASDEIYQKMKDAEVGDQISAKGYLIDYTIYKGSEEVETKKTSEFRNDAGEGASEIIYVTDFQILQKGNAGYHVISKVSFYGIIFSLAFLIISFFINLFPKKQDYFVKENKEKKWVEGDDKSNEVFPTEFK